ncbi:hypothetical protein ACC764_13470 [Rhizobium ruizarguesonis]|uniref:hypothetical protein n=1 Tax=Rhizobium ruizarguesonis TaxID=2081791 RepID=UPI00102FA0B9|nr:hypothetical protein [Rhizobium ruizarguesonis]TBC98778.1 hypothetical protein ELH25_08785 [Rhizobium ruizarguesonis]TBD15613.1 hypothetical protein ELH24_08740 [Rhizobium ruizarguesonis]TBE83477.1 hypothetical protein ELG98_37405 [Rhizobium ruizarguesonis]
MLMLEQGPLVAVEDDVLVAHLEAALKICLQGTTMEGMDPPTLRGISEDIALMFAATVMTGDPPQGVPASLSAGGQAALPSHLINPKL